MKDLPCWYLQCYWIDMLSRIGYPRGCGAPGLLAFFFLLVLFSFYLSISFLLLDFFSTFSSPHIFDDG